MWRTRIGDIEVLRVEEMLTPGFDPAFLFPGFGVAGGMIGGGGPPRAK